MTFAKGNTYGNRKGRPKKGAALSEFLRAELERAYNGQAITNKERIAQVMVKQACSGNLRAAAWLIDRTEGAAPQRIEHSGPDGGAIPVEVGPARERLRAKVTELATRRLPKPEEGEGDAGAA
jgi:hypothetical protein